MDYFSNLIQTIPSDLLPKKIDSARFVEGGLNNKNILVNSKLLIKEFLEHDKISDPAQNRFLREKETLESLNSIPYSPKLINYHDNYPKLFITRSWVEGKPLTSNTIQNKLKLVINALVKVHRYKKVLSKDYSYLNIIPHYLTIYKNNIRELKKKCTKTSVELAEFASWEYLNEVYLQTLDKLSCYTSLRKKVRIHGDLSNF